MGCNQSSGKVPSTSGSKPSDAGGKAMSSDSTVTADKGGSAKGIPIPYQKGTEWCCGNCGTVNYPYRYSCYGCKTLGGSTTSGGGAVWCCEQCGTFNFQMRYTCFLCKSGKLVSSSGGGDFGATGPAQPY